ncbi:MAG: bifunctional diguanylate cyclase/phosphodiesterase [Ruminococcus sp.]|uniref:putative bifunctional diguanylate cyclase/phosphodiesterase n=1 Tax=Ruminococcus sp. TaxID=41978 RepID=UPI0025F3F305|nr:bifunctional diguanylate cyclase/phosphodiesterase [Ruminococcus sp.]MCR5539293.1 bifunctional diguanylate cyclase/phosphodiesterase [Ruminococcus sp.]
MVKREKKSNSIPDTLARILGKTAAPKGLFFILLVLYLGSNAIIALSAGSHKVLSIAGSSISVYAFAGVFSAISNIAVMFMAVYFGKRGFIAALILVILQFPSMLNGIIRHHNLQSLPGAFTNIFTIIAVVIIYFNNEKIDKFQKNIREQAITDMMTGLPNRFACQELVESLLKDGEKFAVVSIDFDSFKSINDTMGRDAGNKLIIAIAERWKNAANNSETGTVDFMTRQSGDEFTLIIRGYETDDDILKTIRHYQSLLEDKLTVDGCDMYVRGSFGYALYPDDADISDHLFTYADAAMYEVKRTNSSEKVMRFSKELMKIERTLEIERKVRKALDDDTVSFELQPQYDMSHRLRGFESLARIDDGSGNVLTPTEFIPVAEKVGLVDKVDLRVFRHSAAFFGELVRKTGAKITLSVNVSVRHLMKNDFLEEVKSILRSSGLPPEQLEIEITESVLIDSAEKALQCINDIKDMGVKIAIDDFGTGYSSLSYLYNFPADLLKVDKSFIDKMNTNESSKQYVAAIISIGHIMKFDVISEGVEDKEQLDTLKDIGCDYIQGFIWGKPLPKEEAEKLVLSQVSA